MVDYTAHFRFGIPDFDQDPWHADLEAALRAIDEAIYDALLAQDVALWLNSTAYVIGDLVVSPETGKIFSCAIAHTSPATPTTFTTFITANPTYWNASVTVPAQRGAWTTATAYIAGDFVTDSSRYAVCIVPHVSGTFNTDLAAGKWTILIDLSTIGIGINASAEADIASAATCDIGGSTPTRLRVTGSTGITSFGTVANSLKIVRYASTPTITHDATHLILLGGANRTMRAGDIQFLSSNSVGDWRELFFSRADGNPASETAAGVVELATSAETITGTDQVRATHPKGVKDALYAFFPAGTVMLFQQAAAPVGWTKLTTNNDKALRIVSGTGGGNGGSVNFSTLFGRTATDNFTLSQANLPNVNFTVSGITMNPHTHAVKWDTLLTNVIAGGISVALDVASSGSQTAAAAATATTDTVATQGTAASGGTGTALSAAIDMRVAYVDVIAASKD